MNPMYITFAIYLVAVLLIGLAAYFSTRNFDDYILGGRSLGRLLRRCRQARPICPAGF